MISQRATTLAAVVIAAGILGLAYWSTARWLVNSWLSTDYYSHGFLVPVISGVVVWIKRDCFKRRDSSFAGILVLALGAALYIANLLSGINALGALSLLTVLSGLVLSFFGVQTARSLSFPLAFLLFAVPLPFIPGLAFQLQMVSLRSSSFVLEAFRIPIVTSGQGIFLGDLAFTIGPPCSGVNSLLALSALATLFAFVLTGSLYKRVGLVVLAVPLAIAGNILRISSVIAIAHYSDIETAMGWFHTFSSPVLFVGESLVLVLAAVIMKCSINRRILGRQ